MAAGTGSGQAVSATMLAARTEIERLATADGQFAVACRDTGVSPAPVTGSAFATYDDAKTARDAAREYRNAMAALDPDLASYDLAVCERGEDSLDMASVRRSTPERRANGLPASTRTVTVAGDASEEWLRVENAPVVHLRGPETPLDDEIVARQLRNTL